MSTLNSAFRSNTVTAQLAARGAELTGDRLGAPSPPHVRRRDHEEERLDPMKTPTLVATLAAFALAGAGCKGGGEAAVQLDTTRLALYGVLPEVMGAAADPVTDAKIELGRKLFFKTRLSMANTSRATAATASTPSGQTPAR